MSAASVARRRPAARRLEWVKLSDEQLLRLRMCDLRLDLQRSPLRRHIERLYEELDGRGIRFRPHVWLSDEWFSPDGIPGIAVPFYLAHPRLMRLARKMTREVEGSNVNWLMRILRHEAGHAIDSAYRLRRRARWRTLFGPASRPYRSRYRVRPASRSHVQHLGDWYAQSHPTEDFAETFAVWLAPRSGWQRRYAAWPALRKLHFVQQVSGELRAERPPVRCRDRIAPLQGDRRTLEQVFNGKAALARMRRGLLADRLLLRLYSADPPAASRYGPSVRPTASRAAVARRALAGVALRSATMRSAAVRSVPVRSALGRLAPVRSAAAARPAAALLRAHKSRLLAWMVRETGADRYLAHQIMRTVIDRSELLGLQARGSQRQMLVATRAMLRRLVRAYLRSQGLRLCA